MIFLMADGAVAAAPVAEVRSVADMDAYFSGRLLVTQPWGEINTLLISKDGTYSLFGKRIAKVEGNWRLNDKSQFCLKPKALPDQKAAPNEFCHTLRATQHGQSWVDTFGKDQVAFQLQPGREVEVIETPKAAK